MKKAACLTMLAVLGLVAFGYAAQANPAEGPIGLVTGAGGGSFGGLGVTLGGSGSNDLVSIDPMTGVTSVVGTGLPSGLHNFAATLDAAGSRYFYRTGGNLIVVDTQTGALLATLPVPDNLLSVDFDAVTGTLFALVTGAGGGSFGGLGVTLGGSGSNDLVSIDPMTGATSVVGSGLPSGIHNFAATLDAADSRYSYRTGGDLIVVDTQTGALLAMLPVPDNLLSVSTLFSFPVAAVIDIKPGSDPNSINVKSRGKIAVAILTTDTLDATSVDPATVLFGRTGTEAGPVHFALENVDGDEDTDMVLHFNTWATGIQCGDTSASLTGETFSGQMIQGSDSIKTAGCK